MKGNIIYSVHVQSIGWMDFKSEDEIAGTVGESRRIEAIKIKLTDKMSQKFDIYYRSHIQSSGWLNWTKDGSISGSTGLSRRMEAVELFLARKDEAGPNISGGISYIFDDKPKSAYTWYTSNGEKYYTGNDNKPVSGFQWIDGKIYYFDQRTNILLTNRKISENGNVYSLADDGSLSTDNEKIEKLISRGQTKVGNSPYVLGGGRTDSSVSRNHFDCSSFVWWCYNEVGIKLGLRETATTYSERFLGNNASFSNIKRGDIFLLKDYGHIGIYLGGGYFIHSSPSTVNSTVNKGQGQKKVTYTEYSSYYGSYSGGVGVSKLTDLLAPSSRETWLQLQDNCVRRIL